MTDRDEASAPPSAHAIQNPLVRLLGSTAREVVSLSFFLALALRRDAPVLAFFAGSVLNSLSSKVLKRILSQSRPDGSALGDPGMPSSHATSLGFIASYALADGYLGTSAAAAPLAAAYVGACLLHRVQTRLHTWEQVLVGAALGCANAVAWFRLVRSGMNFAGIHIQPIVDILNRSILPESGIMPFRYLFIPAVVGACVVGSVERKILAALERKKKK
uniref:Phosphatidic acid phosphatase type 2/haloperoxidase domain-containing protein n=1 Tax=Corethron hystrix TaxID=216773 RepID=A0A7S1BXR2_9STRA